MALIEKLTAIGDAIREKTGKTDGLTLDAMPGEIEGIQSGGSVITEEWQRPSAWPDLSSLGIPEPGTLYFTYDCRDTISGKQPGTLCLTIPINKLEMGYIEGGRFVSVKAVENADLPTDMGDFVVYRAMIENGWSFTGDSITQLYACPCVEVYGTADGSKGSLEHADSYRGPSPRVKAVTIFGNNAMHFNGTGSSNHDYEVEYLNTQDWADKTAATSMSWKFCSLINIKHLTLPFTTPNVTNFSNFLRGCTMLETLDISTFNTSSATNMSYMFLGCRRLKRLDLSHFVTTKVTNFNSMFDGCFALHDVDFSSLDTSGATTTPISMFYGCPNLTNLKVGKINKSFKFTNCDRLSHESLLNVIAALEATENALTLTIGSKNLQKLTEEEISVATEKGWTVV